MRLAYFTFTDKNEVEKMNAIEIGNFLDCNMMLQAANISVTNSEWGSKPFVWRGGSGTLFAFGLGAISKAVLKKTSLV